MKTKVKDIILIVAIAIIAFSGFLIFRDAFKNTTYNRSFIYMSKVKFVEVDFTNGKIIVHQTEGNYPIIDEEKQTITLLGKMQTDGNRYEIVVKYNFEKHSMQIIEEVSQKNICSNQGEQTAQSIICIPNGLTIIFSNSEEVDVDDII